MALLLFLKNLYGKKVNIINKKNNSYLNADNL
jgi:hypothetical protein